MNKRLNIQNDNSSGIGLFTDFNSGFSTKVYIATFRQEKDIWIFFKNNGHLIISTATSAHVPL